jgi:hypothetical protein
MVTLCKGSFSVLFHMNEARVPGAARIHSIWVLTTRGARRNVKPTCERNNIQGMAHDLILANVHLTEPWHWSVGS